MSKNLNWFALLTRSNFEQTVYTAIVNKKIEAFLPKMKRKSSRKDRNLMIETPLFPGYLFVKSNFEAANQLQILKTVGAVRLLGNQSGPLSIPPAQIESLKILTSTSMDLITGVNIRLKKGDPVMIIKGPMAGAKGEFSRHKGRGRVVIKIDVLGQYAGVEVDGNNVEKLPEFLS
ncbi:MAG: UpxY family transcription antiterminator [Desulfobacula sp.]|jgi:transcription antitermination factor NusG|uniref:UpxY family transcription antiterminator n=1 Tax=Desulfobacula sp. TaxID=2593537 RepID=UPI001D91B9FD|nr:UpxY family transcription antiterminator [Desulfobacula sp.]MBT3485145.1 UpxY family transcription antiterminator [Desulfobacula sp.]MBT3804110.1 UpxY family transcription antiterminator [Desulfobacula sp.]MBT4025349.1 UpxY family transcription antiterminator [Desulfobacula sp.]MBT4199499.1 UpxY family transcription antiterminator [Desulfobacula sp.]